MTILNESIVEEAALRDTLPPKLFRGKLRIGDIVEEAI